MTPSSKQGPVDPAPGYALPPAPGADARADARWAAFVRVFARCVGRPLDSPQAVHAASVSHWRIFWHCFAQWTGGALGWSGGFEPVCEGEDCERSRFFPALRLNYAASLLSSGVAPDDAIAVTECHPDGTRVRWRRADLRAQVARIADALSRLGVGEGDQVVAVLRNDASAVVLALAVTATGASLSTASPDMGLEAIAQRFAPLRPRLLVAHTAPRPFDAGDPLAEKIALLAQQLTALRWVVRLDGAALPGHWAQATIDDLAAQGDAGRFDWPQFGFNHPLFILFSSGTTGRPKCIVHGAGGSLIEHLKEHQLHTGLRHGDRMYFHTSCSWMMWNWQLSALASGAEIVTWDGPVSTAGTLWELVARERVTVFGTSPAYLRMSQDAGLAPARDLDLGALRAILSTGAVLHDAQFDWVRAQVGPVPLQSISGGTDILGCFVLGHPQLPVRRGLAQCRSLGLDVQAWQQGRAVRGVGQLVCVNPFPSRPLGFFGDEDGSAFHAAYFAANPGVWTHGDLIEFSPEGGARLHGRCDGVLNVRGIKVLPADICRVLQDAPEVRESMVVQQAGEPARVLALLVLRDESTPACDLQALAARLRLQVARRLSPAHVPDRFVPVAALPVTHSGKLSEAAARCAVNGLPAANLGALRNPECLAAIRAEVLRAGAARGTASGEAGTTGREDTGDTLEARLQALWRQQLDLAYVGLDDHFLQLGGNSLQAAVIMARVQQMTGRSLPLGTLLHAPTVRALAARVRAREEQPEGSPVVRLRAGVGPPLVLVHGLSGTVMECWAMVQALRTRRPVLGLQARGLDGEAPPHERVQAMAAHYVEALAREAPGGAYALCGYSFGGLVALEMARLLARAGEGASLLCLLDPHLRLQLPAPLRLWHWCLDAAARVLYLPPSERRLYMASLAARWQAAVCGRARPVAPVVPAGEAMRESHREVVRALGRALAAYAPQPYEAGPVLFVRAHVPLEGYVNPMPVWRRVLRGGLQVERVSGSHLALVRAQGPRVAAIIDRALEPLSVRDTESGTDMADLPEVTPAGGSS